jgi:hypothetical protein
MDSHEEETMSTTEDEQTVRTATKMLLNRSDQLLARLDQAKDLLGALVVEAPAPRRKGGLVVKMDNAYAKALARAIAFLQDEKEES